MIWTHPGAPGETKCKIISGNLDHVTIEYDNGRRESKYIAELRATGGIAEVSAEILKVNMKEIYNMRCVK